MEIANDSVMGIGSGTFNSRDRFFSRLHQAVVFRALMVMHNCVRQRGDGTTAAERFFGQEPRDVFGWLLGRMPDLPRPAAKRPKKAG